MADTDLSTAIVVTDVSKSFGPVRALDHVSFSVPRNSIYGVLGPNGAGKTTLFSVIAGFLTPLTGSVSVLGNRDVSSLRGKLAILPQDARFQANIPIVDQLVFFLRLLGRGKKEAQAETLRMLETVELDTERYREAAGLSHGMYKRLALAQAFLGEPEVVILDEPTSGLDWKSAERIRQIIKDLRVRSTVLVSSHDMDEMRTLCDHVAVLDSGKLIAAGPVDTVTGASISVTCTLSRELAAEELEACRKVPDVKEMRPAGPDGYTVVFGPGLSRGAIDRAVMGILSRLVSAGAAIRSFQEDNRLADFYMRLTERTASEAAPTGGPGGSGGAPTGT
jgi:ABC-type multidrug transport system ATPase subunit